MLPKTASGPLCDIHRCPLYGAFGGTADISPASYPLGQDRVAAAERRIDNDRTSNPNRGRAGLERARLELHVIESQRRLRGLLE